MLSAGKSLYFKCVICQRQISNRFNHDARSMESPPVCNVCIYSSYPTWTGRFRQAGKPQGGTFRDKDHAMRLYALAEAIQHEANRQIWDEKYAAT